MYIVHVYVCTYINVCMYIHISYRLETTRFISLRIQRGSGGDPRVIMGLAPTNGG